MDAREQQRGKLHKFPEELIVEVSKSFHSLDYISVYQTCRLFRRIFSNESKILLNSLRQLLEHTALGEWDNAQVIWKKFPDLLSGRGTIYYPSPKVITSKPNPGCYKYTNQTAWQIALRNEDYQVANEMGECMSIEEKKKQFLEIFPDSEITNDEWNIDLAKQLINKVFIAICQDDSINGMLDVMSDLTREALNALFHHAMPVVTQQTGFIFDANIYFEAIKLFNDKFDEFKNWYQRYFWCVCVEDHLSQCLGTGYTSPQKFHFFNGIYGFRERASNKPSDDAPSFFKDCVKQKKEQWQNYAESINCYYRNRSCIA